MRCDDRKERDIRMLYKENCHFTGDIIIFRREERDAGERRQRMASRKGHGSDMSPHDEHMADC